MENALQKFHPLEPTYWDINVGTLQMFQLRNYIYVSILNRCMLDQILFHKNDLGSSFSPVGHVLHKLKDS